MSNKETKKDQEELLYFLAPWIGGTIIVCLILSRYYK